MTNKIEKSINEINPTDVEQTYQSVRGYVVEAQQQVYRAVNSAMVEAYWKIGKEIYEACGENERAAYGKQILAELSRKLSAEFGKGFDESNLRTMRRFYLAFPIQDAVRPELSWTHYRELIKVADRDAREFYLDEAAKAGWSSRQLQRQIHTMYYDRILASKDKDSVAAEIQTTEPKPEYEQIIKDPYVLEFLDLPANEHYYESDIEQALIDCRSSCWSWDAVSHSWRDRSTSMWMAGTSISTSFSTTILQNASCL